MMDSMYKKFSEDHGLSQSTPPPFSTLKYLKEIAKLEKGYNDHFNTTLNMLTNEQFTLTTKFFETIASRVIHVYEVANRDVENWLKAVMAPMETQVREHQLQLRRRLESIKRIHKATDTLEDRITELEQMEAVITGQLDDLQQAATEPGAGAGFRERPTTTRSLTKFRKKTPHRAGRLLVRGFLCLRNLALGAQFLVLGLQLILAFGVFRIDDDAIHRANRDTLRLIIMTDAFGAQGGIDDIDFVTLRNRAVGALGFAHVAVDAFVGNH